MLKYAITITLLSFAAYANAQSSTSSSSASQNVALQLDPVIEITNITSSDVNIGFSNINHYVNGVQSSNQEFKVKSNHNFVVTVKTDANSFSYSGPTFPAPVMPIDNILYLSVASNNTGGVTSPLFNAQYTTLSASPKQLLTNCLNGSDRRFAINYKAIPSTEYPAGTYSVGVIYTATQE